MCIKKEYIIVFYVTIIYKYINKLLNIIIYKYYLIVFT